MSILRKSLLAIAAASALGLAAPAFADVLKFKAELSGAAEVPPTTSKATGVVEATFDTATKALTWTGRYADLTGPALAAHFHGAAAAGANAGVMVPADAKESPFKGAATLTDEQAKALLDGQMYFNVHTAANKGGEVRGQIAAAK